MPGHLGDDAHDTRGGRRGGTAHRGGDIGRDVRDGTHVTEDGVEAVEGGRRAVDGHRRLLEHARNLLDGRIELVCHAVDLDDDGLNLCDRLVGGGHDLVYGLSRGPYGKRQLDDGPDGDQDQYDQGDVEHAQTHLVPLPWGIV